MKTYKDLILMNAKQIASGLFQTLARSQGMTPDQQKTKRINATQIHFHDDSTASIAWNDVDAVKSFNEHTGANLPVPLLASQGYSQHHHTSEYDGGFVPVGGGVHDHRDNFNGGFAFACYHPGTSLPQMPWAI